VLCVVVSCASACVEGERMGEEGEHSSVKRGEYLIMPDVLGHAETTINYCA
jgi:hypothetical protein